VQDERFIAALSAVNKVRSTLNLAQIVEKRANDLYAGKAVPLKTAAVTERFDHAQNTCVRRNVAGSGAQPAANSRPLRRANLHLSADQTDECRHPIYSPIGGTVIQRKVGPASYQHRRQRSGLCHRRSLDGLLTAFVRETEASGVAVGQQISSRCWRCGKHVQGAHRLRLAAIDPTTRRLLFAPRSITRTACSNQRCSPT